MRGVAAIERGLVALGIADYRIATGAVRRRVSGGSGAEPIMLAK